MKRNEWLVIFAAMAALVVAGCDEKAQQINDSTELLRNRNDAPQAVDTAGKGGDAHFNFYLGAGGGPAGATPATVTFDPNGRPVISKVKSDAGGGGVDAADAKYVLAGNTFNVTTGGTAQTPTATQNSAATGTRDGENSPPMTTSQQRRTGLTANVPFAPGGIAQAQGTSGAGEGDAASDWTNTTDQRIARLEAKTNQAIEAVQAMGALLEKTWAKTNAPAASAPSTAPATTEP